MHASNLLKVVLKPRTISSSSSGQSLNTKKDGKSHGHRASSPDNSALASLSVSKKKSPAPVPVKMSCLCAPTNHAGSFRCRLHRGTQQSWGGRPLAPAAPSSGKPSPAASETGSPVAPVAVGNGSTKRVVRQSPASRQPSLMNFAPVHRTCDARPSRLSKVSAAGDVESPVSEAHAAAPTRDDTGTMRYLKFTGGAGCASGAVLEGGMVFMKKLQTGGKDVMRDVFGSSTGLSRAGLSL